MGRGLRAESGQALTEFALVLPLLVLFVVAAVQAGITLSHYQRLTDAVRAGARAASVEHTSDAALQAIDDASGDLQLDGTPSVQPSDNWSPGSDVTVSAKAPYSIELFGFTVISGDLTSSTVQRVE